MDDELYQKLKKALIKSFDESVTHMGNYYLDHQARAAYMNSQAALTEALIKLEEHAPKKKKQSPLKPPL